MSELAIRHRHGHYVHAHPHKDPHRHLRHPFRSETVAPNHIHKHGHGHTHGHEHGHSHGLVDRSILRSRAGIKAVSLSLAVLTITAVAQTAIYVVVLSVALLADLIHNFGDALTAIPLGLAFFLRSARAERWAGLAVVGTIFVSAVVALVQTILRFIHPHTLTHLWWLAAAGVIGFVGNEIAAQIRLRAGKRLSSPALIADGNHARADGFVSLGVLASAALVALGAQMADPVIGLIITLVILRITWQSWRTISTTEPGEMHDDTP
jgi:divalent metal cation (Fe/Co/Zn/Cd) transporter